MLGGERGMRGAPRREPATHGDNASRWRGIFLILLLGGATALGFLRLFELRFQAGDVYPPYCSLRSDPLGTKVLHDALLGAPGFSVSRNFQPLEKIPDPADTAVIYAGASTDSWQLSDVEQLETLARNGARVIVTFQPLDKPPVLGKVKAKPKAATPEDEEPEVIELREIAKRWGFSPAFELTPGAGLAAHSTLSRTEAALSWHTGLEFGQPGKAWRVLYSCRSTAAIMERAFGRGSIVIATDSYFLSNEAMRAERAPRLLAFLLGSRTRVVFDETHLGVEEKPGIATLVRKYRLEGLLAAMMALGGLFAWQSSASFLPPKADREEDSEIVTGKDSTAGFVSLLRRGIAPSRLMEECLDQWKKSFARERPGMAPRMEAAAAGREPVEAYRAISQILAEKK